MKSIPSTNCTISESGEVRHITRNKVYCCHVDGPGYLFTRIYNTLTGKRVHIKIHRELAKAYIPNPQGKPMVNHIDGNKLNNNLSNLEWVTCSENLIHAHKLKLISKRGVPIEQLSLAGEVIKTYERARQAEVDGFRRAHIIGCCKGKRSTHGGYRWRYK